MSATREQITTELFNRLKAVTFPAMANGAVTWALASRRVRLWGEVDPSLQPSMMLAAHAEVARPTGTGKPRQETISYTAYIYFKCGAEDEVGDTYINNIMDGVEYALRPDPGVPQNVCTLGGRVTWARIEGGVFRDPGDLDGQGLLIVPISVMLP